MKAAVFYGKEDLRVQDIPVVEPKDDEVMVRVKACGICGTDVHIFNGEKGAGYTPPHTVLGHEFSGVVERTGAHVTSVQVGERVCVDPNDMCGACFFCRQGKGHFCENMTGIGTGIHGGFAEYCTVREKQIYKIPSSLTFEEAAMSEPLACCLHGMDLIGSVMGKTVLIVGGGTIGLIMLQLVAISGAATVIVAEPVRSKRDLAKSLGADLVYDPISENISTILENNTLKQIDVAIECVGKTETMSYTVEHTGKCGTAMLFGLTNPDAQIEIKPFQIFEKEVAIKASFINPYTQRNAVALLGSGKIDAKNLITDEYRLNDIVGLFESNVFKGKGKIIIKP